MKTLPRNLSQRLALYGLGAGAVSVASQADAKIISSGNVNFSGNTIHFDLQNVSAPSSSFMSNDDFVMKSDCTKAKAKIAGEGNYCPAIAASLRYGRPYAEKLFLNETIGDQNFYKGAYFNDYNVGPPDTGGFNAGDWRPGDTGFVGLRLIINGNAFYGWAEVTLNNLNCHGPVFLLRRYAFSTEPNQSIAAGERKAKKGHVHLPPPTPGACGSPTPEVSATSTSNQSPTPAAAIGLLSAGAAGVNALKKRRKNSSSI